MLPCEPPCNSFGQDIGGHAGRGAADAQTPALCSRQLRDLVNRRIVIAQDVPRALQQLLAGFGQHTRRGARTKSLTPNSVLQLADLHADGGLRHVYTLRGRR